MKKGFIALVVFMSLLLAGCADKNDGTSKPKAYVPYSALVKDESASSKSESAIESESTDTNPVDLEDSDNVPTEIDDDDNSIDYDALTEAIADKVADKIAEKLEKEKSELKNEVQESIPSISSSQNNDNISQPSNNQDDDNGYTTTAKYSSNYQENSTSTTQTQDNSQIIYKLNQTIEVYEDEISLYKAGIDGVNEVISKLDVTQAECEDALKKANIELANAKKKTVWVFAGNEFKQVPDEGAVSTAQEKVNNYESLIAECKLTKEKAQKQIEQYEIEIAARESAIVVCQAEINNLS